MPQQSPALLVVDDEDTNRNLLARLFVSKGFQVETASSGADALERVRTGSTDLVLLDMNMPGMSGFDVLKEIRASYTPGALPVVMVTGFGETRDHVQALELGANDYVAKPIDFPVVLARVKTQLARQQAERALKESEERYALAVRGANDGIWDWRLDISEGYFSPRWRSVLGYDEQALLTSLDVWWDRVHPNDLGPLKAALNEHLVGSTTHFEYEHRVQSSPDSYRWVLARAVAVRDAKGVAVRVAGSLTDITEGKVADALTGLPNRVLLMDRLGRLLEHAKRHPDFQVVVMFLDLDRFKVINDSLGHHAGDELLVEAARRLDGCLRSTDTVARIAADRAPRDLMTGSTLGRMGGDEFVVVLGGLRQTEGAAKVADRLHGAFSQGFRVRGHEVFVSLSIGIAMCADGDSTPDDLLREADTAMYRAKGLGPSRTETFSPDMRTEARVRLQTDTDLRHAMGRHEFELWYQPIVSLESGKVNTVEALLRWRHPTRGFISTQQFIATAETTGLIVPMGYWVLERACADLRRWEVVDPRSSEVFVGVNLSAKQLVVPDLVTRIEEIVNQAGVRPGRIEFELTESSVMVDPELAQRQLEALKRKGFRLSIDDFGTGHSSLSYVHRFPVDRIKVDRSFLLRARTEHETDVVMRAIVDLGMQLGLEVVAEGVETDVELAKLQVIGCKLGQGYLFAPPRASDSVPPLFRGPVQAAFRELLHPVPQV
jgi:diguanylate cyclase (GGDEF)-like protein/PAS domain S-box-containing protein